MGIDTWVEKEHKGKKKKRTYNSEAVEKAVGERRSSKH